MTQFENKRFGISQRGRSPSVCEANGTHGEPDNRGRCFLCGTKLVAQPEPGQ